MFNKILTKTIAGKTIILQKQKFRCLTGTRTWYLLAEMWSGCELGLRYRVGGLGIGLPLTTASAHAKGKEIREVGSLAKPG